VHPVIVLGYARRIPETLCTVHFGEISGSYSDEFEDGCPLGCYTVYSGRNYVSEVLTAFIGDDELIDLIMEVANMSETSVSFYQTTWCNIPEDSHLQ
jgi:hypothetical protein